jgi:hypothetical protein
MKPVAAPLVLNFAMAQTSCTVQNARDRIDHGLSGSSAFALVAAGESLYGSFRAIVSGCDSLTVTVPYGTGLALFALTVRC